MGWLGFFLSFYPRVGSDGALQIPHQNYHRDPAALCSGIQLFPGCPFSLLHISHGRVVAVCWSLTLPGLHHHWGLWGKAGPHRASLMGGAGVLMDGCVQCLGGRTVRLEREGADNLLAFNSPGVLGLNTKCSLVNSQ